MRPKPRLRDGTLLSGRPSKVMVPSSGDSSPAMSRNSVVLPQPLGPSRQTMSPRSTVSETRFTAKPSPYCRVTPDTSSNAIRSPPRYDT